MTSRRWWLFALLVISSCLWSSYEQILRVHVEVLSSLVDKALARAESGRRPSPNDITELLYPLERGRQFARQYRKHAGRASYQSFATLLDAYERLAKRIDVARVSSEDWEALRHELPAEGRAWHVIAARVMSDLEHES